jgi:hypothetical protein
MLMLCYRTVLALVAPLAVMLTVCPGIAVEPGGPTSTNKAEAIRPGMTAAQVRELLGAPKRVARQILYARYVEQWTYDDPAVRIEFDWRKGQEKQIQTVQLLTTPRP